MRRARASRNETTPEAPVRDSVAVALTGGGARAAYQVGLLRCVAEIAPDYRFPIITGISAGAVNAAYLASHPGSLEEATDDLRALWCGLEVERVLDTRGLTMARNVLRWGAQLVSGGTRAAPEARGLLDTSPLGLLLERELRTDDGVISGIGRNLDASRLSAVALTTLSYDSGRTTTWVQGCDIPTWERADRSGARTRLTVDHVLASAALPLLFPAVRLDGQWHGDGGIGMSTPLAPAVHLGANRIITVSTRHKPGRKVLTRRGRPYPKPAQILGQLFNVVFLDAVDQDAERLRRLNDLVRALPPHRETGLREIDALVVRPSVDLGALARQYEPALPRWFRFLTRGLGTRELQGRDFLSLLMFSSDYIEHVIAIGEADARRHRDELSRLLLD